MSRFIVIETAMWLDLIVPVYDSFNRTKSWSSPFYLAKESLNLAIMRSEDECLCSIWDWFWFSPWLSWIGVKPVLFVKGNDLIDPLSSDLLILCNFPNRSSPLPLIYDSSYIPIG